MEERNEKLRNGLRKLYYAEIIAIVSLLCTILALIPVLGLLILLGVLVAMIAGLVLSIMGLVKLGDLHSNYIVALVLSVINGILSLFDDSTVISLLSAILSLVAIWLLIKTTNGFLEEIGRTDVMEKGRGALTCNIAVTAISVLCTLASIVAAGLAVILLVVALIVSLVGLVFYVSYLKQASEAF